MPPTQVSQLSQQQYHPYRHPNQQQISFQGSGYGNHNQMTIIPQPNQRYFQPPPPKPFNSHATSNTKKPNYNNLCKDSSHQNCFCELSKRKQKQYTKKCYASQKTMLNKPSKFYKIPHPSNY